MRLGRRATSSPAKRDPASSRNPGHAQRRMRTPRRHAITWRALHLVSVYLPPPSFSQHVCPSGSTLATDSLSSSHGDRTRACPSIADQTTMSASNYTSERTIRAMIFRREAKAGIGEIMTYLRARKAIKDPMFWPPRPVLSFIGVKNVLGRLRADLDTLEMFYGRKTSHLISIVSLQRFSPSYTRADNLSSTRSWIKCTFFASRTLPPNLGDPSVQTSYQSMWL